MRTTKRYLGPVLGMLALVGTFLCVDVYCPEGQAVKADSVVATTRDFPIRNDIDKFILLRLHEDKIEPSAACTDEEFLRRVYLDVGGVIPARGEAKRFLADQSPDKRAKLIDSLLSGDRYAEHWAVLWGDLLREHTGSKPQEGTSRGSYREWIKEALAKNTPYDQFAEKLITARGNADDNPAVNFYLRDEMNRVETVNTIASVFMGTRMACAQCHDHPFDKWTQNDFHGLMAYFGRTQVAPDQALALVRIDTDKRLPEEVHKMLEPYFKEAHEAVDKRKQQLGADGEESGMGMGMGMEMAMKIGKGKNALQFLKELDENKTLTKEQNLRAKQVFQQNQVRQVVDRGQGEYKMPTDGDGQNKNKGNSGEVVTPNFPWDLSKKNPASGSRRKTLAEFITTSHQFAAVQVNRLWSQLMGKGIIDPTDDFREKNPASHPELLDYLTDEFIKAKFDNRQVLRLILNSSTYQRSSMPTASNRADTALYSHQRLRRMTAEETFDSIVVATGHEKGMGASNRGMADMAGAGKGKYMMGERKDGNTIDWAEDLPTPQPTGSFMNTFNQPVREQLVTKRDDSGSISQALEMLNGKRLNDSIANSPLTRGLLEQRASGVEIVNELFLAVLSRLPTSGELKFCGSMLRTNSPSEKNTGELQSIQDLHWALLNTREFTFIR